MEEKLDKLSFTKIKNGCLSKDTMKKTGSHARDWGKIFFKNISDQGLVSIIYKELLEFNKKMATNF